MGCFLGSFLAGFTSGLGSSAFATSSVFAGSSTFAGSVLGGGGGGGSTGFAVSSAVVLPLGGSVFAGSLIGGAAGRISVVELSPSPPGPVTMIAVTTPATIALATPATTPHRRVVGRVVV